MKTLEGLVFSLAMLFVAATANGCSHDKAHQTTPAPADPTLTSKDMAATPTEDPMVDPTLPSWAPRSCVAYHTAVDRIVSCTAVDAAKRETIRQTYEAKHKAWQDMHDMPQGAIADVQTQCASDLDAVKAQTDPTCPQTTTKPVAQLQ